MAKKKFSDYLNGEEPVLVDFHATWCGPCKTLAPVLEDVAEDFSGRVKILKVDVDKNPKTAAKFKVRGVPTLILFKEGKILWQQSGALTKHQLSEVLKGKI